MDLLIPTRAYFKDDVESRALILKEEVTQNYRGVSPGFEVVLLGGPDGDITDPEKIVANLAKYSADPNFYLALHCPLERDDYESHRTDIASDEGLFVLEDLLNLAVKIKAQQVIVHPENFHRGSKLLNQDISQEQKEFLQKKVKLNISRVQEVAEYEGIVSVENMPYPLMGDDKRLKSVKSMVYDPVIMTAADMQEFDNVALDTAHYFLMSDFLNYLGGQFGRGMSFDEDFEGKIVGLTEEDKVEQPRLMDLMNNLGDKIKYIQINDAKGIWVPEGGPNHPQGDHFEEGIVPKKGRFSYEFEKVLIDLAQKDIPISVTVWDEDHRVAKETIESLRYVLAWLAPYKIGAEN